MVSGCHDSQRGINIKQMCHRGMWYMHCRSYFILHSNTPL